MSLNYEMARYTELTGEDGTKVSISRLGGYLDGYEQGRKDEREKIISELEDVTTSAYLASDLYDYIKQLKEHSHDNTRSY